MAVDDLADACVFVMKYYSDSEMINIGTGRDLTIKEFATYVAHVVGYDGKIVFDRNRPDGVPQKLLDVSKLTRLGWQTKTSLREGLVETIEISSSLVSAAKISRLAEHNKVQCKDERNASSKTDLGNRGAGFLGSHLCKQLLASGANVICVDNFFTGTRTNIEHLIGNELRMLQA